MDLSEHDRAQIEARAFLFDLLSLSFSYPTEELYNSLRDGVYAEELAQRVVLLPLGESFAPYIHELSLFAQNTTAKNFEEFASEYVALFDHAKEPPPLHLYAHLYDDEPQPVPVYQRLNALYGEFGIELKSSGAVEQHDHLGVELEFFAYLHQLLLQTHDDRRVQEINNAIHEFCMELEWVNTWAEKLRQRPEHAFYHPVMECLMVALHTTCKANEK